MERHLRVASHATNYRLPCPEMIRPGRTTEQFLLAAKQAEIRALRNLANTCQLVSCVSELIHQLQRERGVSNIYLSSSGGHFHQQRQHQLQLASSAEAQLRELLEERYLHDRRAEASPRLLSKVAFVLQGLDELAELRPRVEHIAIPAPHMTEAFGRLIAGLLGIVFEAADSAGDAAVSRALVAQFNFMQGKEYAGQERAWAAIGFAGCAFTAALKERLEALRHAQERAFSIFERFASAEQLRYWQELKNSTVEQQLQALRLVIDRIEKPTDIPPDTSEIWYEKATARIDAMHSLEEMLTQNLIALSRERVEMAHRALHEHEARMETLAAGAGTPAATAVLLDMNLPIAPGVADDLGQDVDPLHASNTRPLYDLLREQAEHLKRTSEELEAARRALAERKLVEQAKGLLMHRLGLSEVQAYQRLRQKAMNSNLRLVDVCEHLIAAAGKTKDRS